MKPKKIRNHRLHENDIEISKSFLRNITRFSTPTHMDKSLLLCDLVLFQHKNTILHKIARPIYAFAISYQEQKVIKM